MARPYLGAAASHPTDLLRQADGDARYALASGYALGRRLNDNGAMEIHQRADVGVGVTGITTTAGTALFFSPDRYPVYITTLGTWTGSVEADAPSATQFRKSVKILNTTAKASPSAGDFIIFGHTFEGRDVQTILKGTSAAKSITVQFWVKSNKTGTYIVELADNDNTRYVSASYTVNVSGTWEFKTITFPPDTTGTIGVSSNGDLSLFFWLGAGTTYTSGTLETTWVSPTPANRASGQTNLASATTQYWQMTGLQVEAGTVATTFETRTFDAEKRRCKRFFRRMYTATAARIFATGQCYLTTAALFLFNFDVPMRIQPTLANSTASQFSVTAANAVGIAATGLAINNNGAVDGGVQAAEVTSSMLSVSVASGLVAGNAAILLSGSATVTTLDFSADL